MTHDFLNLRWLHAQTVAGVYPYVKLAFCHIAITTASIYTNMHEYIHCNVYCFQNISEVKIKVMEIQRLVVKAEDSYFKHICHLK